MALKSVVVDTFFDQIAEALSAFARVKGPFSLVLLTPSPHHRLQWDVTVAAEWMDSASLLRSISDIKSFLQSKLVNSSTRLGRVRVRTTSDSLVQTITSSLEIPEFGTAYQVTGLELDVFGIHEAVCLLSRPVLHDALLQKVSA